MTSYLLREALGMQVFSVLSKPVDFNLLLDAMARVLKRGVPGTAMPSWALMPEPERKAA